MHVLGVPLRIGAGEMLVVVALVVVLELETDTQYA